MYVFIKEDTSDGSYTLQDKIQEHTTHKPLFRRKKMKKRP